MTHHHQVPSIGRIVHYRHAEDRKIYPAVITEVDGGPIESIDDDTGRFVIADSYRVTLTIFRTRKIEWRVAAEGEEWGMWSWPPKVESPLAYEVLPPVSGEIVFNQ